MVVAVNFYCNFIANSYRMKNLKITLLLGINERVKLEYEF